MNRPRPDAAWGRYALLILVPVLAACAAGELVYFVLCEEEYGAALKACMAQARAAAPDDVFERSRFFAHCRIPVELGKAGFVVAAGAVAVVGGVVLLRLLPRRLYRRAGRMRVAGERWQSAAAGAVRSLGGSVLPVVMIAADCREAFTVRTGGRVRIVLPRAVVTLPDDQALALLRHECAHVVAGDVRRVWLTRGVWWAAPVLFAAPVAVRVLEDDDPTPDSGDWVLRVVCSALLLTLLWVVARSVLRSREHAADLRAAGGAAERAALCGLLARGAGEDRTSGARRWAALHPSIDRRLAVVEAGVAVPTRWIDGLAIGALATCMMATTTWFLRPVLPGLELGGWGSLVAALVPGVVLGVAWGALSWETPAFLPWWRRMAAVLGLAAGVLVGLLLAPTALTMLVGDLPYFLNTWWLTALMVAGAGALTGTLGALIGNAPPAARWWASVTAAAVWVGAIAPIDVIATVIGEGGPLVGLAVAADMPSWAMLVGQGSIAVVAIWRCPGRPVAAVVTVGLAAAVVVTSLLSTDPLVGELTTERIVTDCTIAAGAGVAAAVLALVLRVDFGLAMAAAWGVTVLVAAGLAVVLGFAVDDALRFSLLPALNLLMIGLLALAAVTVPVSRPDPRVRVVPRSVLEPVEADR
ncbi:hypothetical protein GCM10022243_37580 [Saccharothrix violaceirubra]|uniref:Zn-dependent protease with chaperone function n=1 Tax=Saccharothrix violaceirubra TaxID=413306 RepID=A0A7W7T4B8_9PSEU|nr:M48 family metalloprotease [Saccharothrix violaceirubra]MBB4966328.1 Zn-dependent protease with chaperone function [Saccharothrix violaceirubra]